MTSEGLEHALCRMKHVHAIDNPAFEFYTRQVQVWDSMRASKWSHDHFNKCKVSWNFTKWRKRGKTAGDVLMHCCCCSLYEPHPPSPPPPPPQSSQVTASTCNYRSHSRYNVTRFGYDTNKEILLYSKAYYAQKQRKHFGPDRFCSFLECPAKAYPYHSNEKTLLYTYRCESG